MNLCSVCNYGADRLTAGTMFVSLYFCPALPDHDYSESAFKQGSSLYDWQCC